MLKRFAVCAALLMIAAVAQGQSVFYGIDGQAPSSLFLINAANGSATLIASTGFAGVGSIAVSPGGVLYGITGNSGGGHQLITINTSTGAGTLVGATGISNNVSDISFRSDGVLFAQTGGGSDAKLYTVNTSTGLATLVGASPCSGGCGLAFNPSNALYLSPNGALATVNPANATQTAGPTLTNFPGNTQVLSGMSFQPGSGTLYGIAFAPEVGPVSYLVTVNTTTGGLTNIGSNGAWLEGIAISGSGSAPPPSSTPVPSTILLIGTGGLFLAAWLVFGRRAAVTL